MGDSIRKRVFPAAAGQAIPRSFDQDASALHTVNAPVNPLYVRDDQSVWSRSLQDNVADPDPNTMPPSTDDAYGGAENYGLVAWHMQLAAGQSADVAVYVEVEVEPDTFRWLQAKASASVTSDVETITETRFRRVFFRVTNRVGFTAVDPVALRATGV